MSAVTDARKVGILVVTHGGAGEAMVATATRLLGAAATEGIHALEILVGEGKAHIKERLEPAIAEADVGAGVVVACDLHGSTPTNCAIEAMHDGLVAVVCGVNFAMLVKLATATRVGTTPAQVAQAAVDTAVRSIRVEKAREDK
jgi:mannose/fructose-specific phosphotransferase system component IIA